MLAVDRLGGRMRPQVPIVKSLASALCIGSGGSVGREGPIVQIGSALGSVLGQLVRVTRVPAAAAGRVRCRGGDLGDVQRADRRGVLRAGADPAQLRHRVVRVRRAQLGHRRRDRTRRVRIAPVPDAAGVHASPRRSSSSSTPASASSPCGVGVTFIRVLYVGEDLADRLWRGPELAAARRSAGSCSGCCCSRCRRCTASATRCWSTPLAGST